MIKTQRPLLRYHGGKWLLAPWIISHFPAHRVYVEPFGGAASVLLRKPPSYAEVYNDLDAEVVGLFRVLQDEAKAYELLRRLRMTPFARREFLDAYVSTDCPVESARRLIIRSFMGFGSDGHNGARPTGFRANSNRSGTVPARDWVNYPDALGLIVERFKGVIVEHRDAKMVMAQHDGPDALHYVDPPYLAETRSQKRYRDGSRYHVYAHELTDEDHVELLAFLRTLRGMVILSGYPHAIYDDALKGWLRVERIALADGARPRTECLWINPAAAKMAPQPSLIEAAAHCHASGAARAIDQAADDAARMGAA